MEEFNLLLPTSSNDVSICNQDIDIRCFMLICAHCDDIFYIINDFENHINHPNGCPIVMNVITLEEQC